MDRLRVQNLDVMLANSPKHQPHRTTRKGFNGEPARLVVLTVRGQVGANWAPGAFCCQTRNIGKNKAEPLFFSVLQKSLT